MAPTFDAGLMRGGGLRYERRMLLMFLSGLALFAIYLGCLLWFIRSDKPRFVRFTAKDGRSVDVTTAPGLSERSALYHGLMLANAKLDEDKH